MSATDDFDLTPAGGQSAGPMKEVTLHLPVATLVQLHTQKLLTSKSIQLMTIEALEAFFRKHGMTDAPGRLP